MFRAMKNSVVYKLEVMNSAYNVVKTMSAFYTQWRTVRGTKMQKILNVAWSTHMKWNIPVTEENETGCLWFHYRPVLLSSVRSTDHDAVY